MIASIDHIRGNLLFSASALSHFQFVYHDATTYEPYFYEKMYSAQVTQSYSGISSSGIQYVLSSLTANHLKILLLISRETAGVKEGLSFSALYEFCLNEMLVSSEKSLQLIMKELEVRVRVWIEQQDHELIKEITSATSPQQNYVCNVSPKELKAFCDSL